MKGADQSKGFGSQVPPHLFHVQVYFQQLGLSEQDGLRFYEQFQSSGWRFDNGAPVSNWKALAIRTAKELLRLREFIGGFPSS